MSHVHEIKKLICDVNVTLKTEALEETVDITESGMLDSFGFVELMLVLESHFGIIIEDEEITGKNFATIHSINAFITKKQAVKTAN